MQSVRCEQRLAQQALVQSVCCKRVKRRLAQQALVQSFCLLLLTRALLQRVQVCLLLGQLLLPLVLLLVHVPARALEVCWGVQLLLVSFTS